MRIRSSVSFVLLSALFSARLSAADWQPVNPADLALKQSKNEPDAAAEALFREVHIANEQHGASYAKNLVTEYVRIAIFAERGKDVGNVTVPFFRDTTVFNIEGRTIHPDGSIVDLSKDSIFEKVIEKRGFKTKVVTFALPAIEPGSIIEYRYTKSEGETTQRYRQLSVQSEYPVDLVTFYLKPLYSPYFTYPAMRYMPFGCHPERSQPTRDGFDVLTVRNVPAFHEEPYSPPEYSAKQWILIYYEENSKSKDKYWTALGKDRYHQYSEMVKVNGELKATAEEIISGAASDDEKLAKLMDFCRTHIKDVKGDEITTAELDKAKANRNTLDTIKRKEGDDLDIQMAFLALARAAGYDARRADLSDRATVLFTPSMESAYFLNAFDIAVNVNGNWKFYDVTNPSVAPGQLRWQEQGVYALITDPKDPEMVITPMLTAQDTTKNRVATFKLAEDGVLEGDVREILFGNMAIGWREENRHTNDTQREEELRNELKRRFSDFDVSDVKFTANPDPSKPVGVHYHIVVRNYAQRTGKRLFVQPNYFMQGFVSRFPEASRHNNIYFPYPWGELDSVDITLPAGFQLDHGDAPGPINVANFKYVVKIGYDNVHGLIQYRRQFAFGGKDLLFFDTKAYPTMKALFDTMHDSDNHLLTFKSDAATGFKPSGGAQ